MSGSSSPCERRRRSVNCKVRATCRSCAWSIFRWFQCCWVARVIQDIKDVGIATRPETLSDRSALQSRQASKSPRIFPEGRRRCQPRTRFEPKEAEENARHFMVEILAGQGITFGSVRKRRGGPLPACRGHPALQAVCWTSGSTRAECRWTEPIVGYAKRGEKNENDEKEAFPCSSRKLARSRATCGRAADLGQAPHPSRLPARSRQESQTESRVHRRACG